MNCFYHTNRPATGQCTNCGKFLCSECVSKYKPILCQDCYDEIHAQEAKRNTNQGLLIVACAVAFVVLALLFLPLGGLVGMAGPADRIGAAYGFAFCIFGWRGWDSIRSRYNISVELSIPGWVCYFALKAVFAVITGGIFYLIALVQLFTKKS